MQREREGRMRHYCLRVFEAAALVAFALFALASRSRLSQTKPPSNYMSAPRPLMPAIMCYVAGQGPRRADGTIPDNFTDQVRQTLENVKSAVEAAGLTIGPRGLRPGLSGRHPSLGELDEVFASYFPKDPPARAVLGVARAARAAVCRLHAIAVRDLQGKQAVSVHEFRAKQGVLAGNVDSRPTLRLYHARP